MASNLPVPLDPLAEAAINLRGVLRDVLGLSAARAEALEEASGLFGHLPELEFDGRRRFAHRTGGPFCDPDR